MSEILATNDRTTMAAFDGSVVTKIPLRIKKLSNFRGDLPSYQTALASGFDVRAMLDTPMVLQPGERALIPTGLAFEIPPGFEIQARPRSGWAIKQGMGLVNSPGTIDADYRGEVKIIVVNLGGEPVEIKDQDRVAQLVLAPVYQAQFELVEDLESTERGAGGFGSTGKQ
jgi:dUTP pyrophosphatase